MTETFYGGNGDPLEHAIMRCLELRGKQNTNQITKWLRENGFKAITSEEWKKEIKNLCRGEYVFASYPIHKATEYELTRSGRSDIAYKKQLREKPE